MQLKDLKYLLAYVLPLSCFISIYYAGPWSFLTVAIGYVLIPIMDELFPRSKENLSQELKKDKLTNKFFDVLLYLNLPIVYGLLFLFLNRLGFSALSTYEIVGLTLSTGIILGSAGINVAHELGHKPETYNHVVAQLLLLPSLYMHFFIEHNRGHHLHVSTPQDPASAQKGESVYRFFVRSIFGQYIDAWTLERKRLGVQLSLKNMMIHFLLLQVAFVAIIFLIYGWQVCLLFFAAATLSILQLELINYIEHYGLRRKKMENGRYEKVTSVHSWNSNHELGRIFLYELTRHSDHHFKAAKKYQILDHHDESPQLPFGYPASMTLSLFPPLWFKIMDGRIPN